MVVNTGDVIVLQAETNNTAYGIDGNKTTMFIVEGDTTVQMYGNIMSLIHKTDYYKGINLPVRAFFRFFSNRAQKTTASLVNNIYNHPTRDIVLYANTLYGYSFSCAFHNTKLQRTCKIYHTGFNGTFQLEWSYSTCSQLVTINDFTINTTAGYCYANMFNNCTSLAILPDELPAMTLVGNCYDTMFKGCTSLVTIPEDFLPATTLAGGCYNDMFRDCTALTQAPELRAVTLANNCYDEMFRGCTSLTRTPALVAETIGSYSCSFMFADCTSLTNIIYLGAKTVGTYGLQGMFYNCTALVNSPTIRVTSVNNYGMRAMFYNCTSLLRAPSLSSVTTLGNYCFSAMFYNCTSMTTAPSLPCMTLKEGCYGGTYSNDNGSFSATWTNYGMFENCTALTTAPTLSATTLAYQCYCRMFYGCTNLRNVQAELSAETIPGRAYYSMFANCSSLVTPPDIMAKTVAISGLRAMFQNCTSMTWPPFMQMEEVGEKACHGMFQNCTSLAQTPILNAMTLGAWAYGQMFYNCTSLNIIQSDLPALVMADHCYGGGYNNENEGGTAGNYGMFENCTSLVTPPTIYATTFAPFCFARMFCGCTSMTQFQNQFFGTDFPKFCCREMFYGTKLSWMPKLTITSVGVDSFRSAFKAITTLTTISASDFVINCDNIGERAFYQMFNNDTGLTSASWSLTCNSLSTKCFKDMFRECTSLITGPILTNVTYTTEAYGAMFYNCYNLENIQAIINVADATGGSMFQCASATPNTKPNTFKPLNMTNVGGSTCVYCTGLNEVVLPSTVTSVGTDPFSYCSGIVNFTSLTTSFTLSSATVGRNVGKATGTFHIYGDFIKNGDGNHGTLWFRHFLFEQNYTHGVNGTYCTNTPHLMTFVVKGNVTYNYNGGFSNVGTTYSSKFWYCRIDGTITSSWFILGQSADSNNVGPSTGRSYQIIHLTNENVATETPAIINGTRIEKIYVGDGSSQQHDQTILNKYLAITAWSDISAKLDTWYNYMHAQDLPSGYTSLEYVSTNGLAVVDTGVSGNNNNLIMKFNGIMNTHVNYSAFLGNYIDGNTNCWRLCKSTSVGTILCNVNSKQSLTLTSDNNTTLNNQMIKAEFKRIEIKAYYKTVTGSVVSGTANNSNIILGSDRLAGNNDGVTKQIFYFKIDDGATPLLEYIPAKRNSDDAIGFYDKVTNTFIKSTTSTEFEPGPVYTDGPVIRNDI